MANKNKNNHPSPPPKTQQEALRQAQVAVQAAAAHQAQLQHQLAQAHGGQGSDQIENQLAKQTAKLQAMREARNKLRTIMYTTPGTPGQKSPVIDPFMNADDMQSADEARAQLAATLAQQDYELSDLATSTEADKAAIDRQHPYDRRDASDEAAARGLFQSSIRDAELWDIDATAAIRKNLLDVGLSTKRIQSQNAKTAAQAAYDTFQANMHQKMVENAQAASENLPEYLVNPTDATTRVDRLKIPRGGKKNNQGQNNQGQGGQSTYTPGSNKAIYGG